MAVQLPHPTECRFASVTTNLAAPAEVALFTHQDGVYRLTIPFSFIPDGGGYTAMSFWTLERRTPEAWGAVDFAMPEEVNETRELTLAWTSQILLLLEDGDDE